MTRLRIAGATHRGLVRERNEDAWTGRPELRLAAVADGMGGHPAGDEASRLAIETLVVSATERHSAAPRAGASERSDGEAGGEWMAEAVRLANRRILQAGTLDSHLVGMGATLTALVVDGDGRGYTVGHVGDSRAYLVRSGDLIPLTRDHTPLQDRVDAGVLSREEARVHPMRNVLSLALGMEPELVPQVVVGESRPGDVFLLCTDGLTAVLSEVRIAEMIVEAADAFGKHREGPGTGAGTSGALQGIAEGLVDTVLEKGAPDNVTVAIVALAKD